MKATHLQTEYLTEPMGLDITCPRFFWNCEGGVKQTAYQIIAQRDGELLWDSGKVLSGRMTHIRYEGKPLRSRDRVNWAVTLWDENDTPGEKSESWFEMGLLEPSDWKAQWIAGDYTPKKNERYSADCFKKAFSAPLEVKKARLYITACGVYEAKINGRRAGDFVLAPGCTDYRKRLQYQVYDVTGLLEQENTLEIWLGDGWFRGSLGAYGQIHVYGRQTSLLAQLEITYADGRREVVSTDGSFSWSNDGPIRFNDLKDGEVYDARMTPSYSGRARVVKENRMLTASNNVAVREKEAFTPTLLTTPPGKKVLDFGQNIAGFVDFEIQGRAGQTVTLTCGEILDESGELTLKNFQVTKTEGEFGQIKQIFHMLDMAKKLPGKKVLTPRQQVRFICSGGKDHYHTRFAVFGFRYVQVDTEADFDPKDFKAIAVYSDLEQTGSFQCSNEKVNRLYQNTLWSMKGNFLDIPTDCPTRERLGWTGDAQIFFNTGAYLMNTAPFFRKWMQDMEDGKLKAGYVPAVVPYAGMDLMYTQTGSSAGWACAAILLPYRYWKRYGDLDALRRFYPLARGCAEYMIKNTGHTDKKEAQSDPLNKYVYEKGCHLGEWLEPEEFQDKISAKSRPKQTETATAYFHYDMVRMVEIAVALGEAADAKRYEDYARGSAKAYRKMFLADGAPDTDRQAKLVRPLALGLAENDAKLKKELENRLALAVEHREYRIGTGFLSTPFVLPVLTEAGRAGLAYKMLENEQSPGWLCEVNAGATTVWEDWEGKASHNHYSPGAVCQWLFDTVCGIRSDGENHFIIQPVPGGSLTFAEATHQSLYGEVKSRWEQKGDTVTLSVSVPSNTTAEVSLPDGSVHSCAAGTHEFSWKKVLT